MITREDPAITRDEFVVWMRERGVVRARWHANGKLEEIEIGPAPSAASAADSDDSSNDTVGGGGAMRDVAEMMAERRAERMRVARAATSNLEKLTDGNG